MTKTEWLGRIDSVIAGGPYTDAWESLCQYSPPNWYADAKFGIFIHWGVYAVPAFGNEWYPRFMYLRGTPEYEHHIKNWGPHKQFGYKDFIPLFTGKQFDPHAWMSLIKDSGAKYVMPVAEHHDGFAMYDCGFSEWNAVKMGPKRDVIGELQKAARDAGIVFAVSYHRAEQCWFFNGGRDYACDVTDPAWAGFYGRQQDGGLVDNIDISHDIHSVPPSPEHCADWLVRLCELVDRYQPRIVWLDWWIHNMAWKPWLRKFAAYYYNSARQSGYEAAINYKYHAFAYGSAVFDVERGQLAGIRPSLWQTDTAAGLDSWGYTTANRFKKPLDLICSLVDIVSKNGVMLLNIGPRADGSITGEDTAILRAIGQWLRDNGEGIYDTRPWHWFGEGPTLFEEGAFRDMEQVCFTSRDFRFTYKAGTLYAFVMKYPQDGKTVIPSLKKGTGSHGTGDFHIASARILGHDRELALTRDNAALTITVKGTINTEYPVGFALRLE